MRRNLLLLIVTILLYECSNINNDTEKNEKTVLVDIKAKVPRLEKTIDFIKLEAIEGSMIKTIRNIEITDDFIYVVDGKTLLLFGSDGTFFKKIKRGKGPGEITTSVNLSYDEERQEIYVIDIGNILHIYNSQGEFKETHFLGGPFGDIIRFDDENVLLYSLNLPKYIKNKIFVYNLTSRTITNEFVPINDLYSPKLEILTYNNFTRHNNQIYLSLSNSRDIYKIDNTDAEVYTTIDFGKLNPSLSYVEKFDRIEDFEKAKEGAKYVDFIKYFYKFDEFSLLGFHVEEDICGIIYNDASKIPAGRISELFGLPNTPSFNIPKNATKDKLIFIYKNDFLFQDDIPLKEGVLEIGGKKISLNANDNPLIVVVNI